MKNTICSAALLLVILGSCVLSLYFTRETSDDLLNTLDACEDAVLSEDWPLAMDEIYLATALWNKSRTQYAVFLRHDELCEVSDSFSRIVTLVELRDRKEFLVENGLLCDLIERIGSLDFPTLENIL